MKKRMREEEGKEGGLLSSVLCPVYITLEALLALYGDNSTIPLESPIYGYIDCIRADYEGYADKDSKG